MEKCMDTFAWTCELQCPPTICTDSVKKILRTGLVGLLWDDLSDVIVSAEMAKTIRKNILLHHLRQGTSTNVINCMKNISQLNLDRSNLQKMITKLEDEYEQQDYIVRQKAQKLRDISSKRYETRITRDLLKIKCDETSVQLRDCNNMKLVCRHLMPSCCKDLDVNVMSEMFNVVTSLWTGANKRQVWDTVAKNLDYIEIPTLWQHLYLTLTQDVDALIKSTTTDSSVIHEKNVNVGITKIYGKHICLVSKRLFYSTKAKHIQQNVLEFIQKIEAPFNNCVDMSEWLALALEVRKLETEQQSLQREIDKIRVDLEENNLYTFDLAELTSEIENVDIEVAQYIRDIQHSFHLLKSTPTLLMKIKDEINLHLQKIKAMRVKSYDFTILNNDLTKELDIFHEVDINAFRKIMLKGDIGVYRYTKSCFSEANLPVTNSQASNITSYFPLVQTPLYSLIDCYKNLITMYTYKKYQALQFDENINTFQLPTVPYEENNFNSVELLNLSKAVNFRTKSEIDEFNDILNSWVSQAVQKVMEIIEKTVDDATFSEWIERYDLLSYMLQNSRQ